jgi:uncharacterized protein YjbI with pentapeptide repeats
MNQDQQPRPWWSEHWALLVLVALVVALAVLVGLGYWLRWSWTGFTGSGVSSPKLIWDWLELLIIPIVLGAGAFWFNTQTRKSERELARRERENDRAIAEDRVREEALQRYLDRMQELILDKGLRRSEKDAEIRDVARARTLTVVRSLDGNRKGQVVRFLYESDLIEKTVEESQERQVIEAIIDLQTANLRDSYLNGAHLRGANLSRVDLSFAFLVDAFLGFADLTGADLSLTKLSCADLSLTQLSNADLTYADLSYADLGGANLGGADLPAANLTGANLLGAHLTGAKLTGANLFRADLPAANLGGANLFHAYLGRADLSGTDLSDANLREANLREAKGWTNEQLAQAASLVGATMPDGTVMTEEAWEEFKKHYR